MMSTNEKCLTLKYLDYILWPAFALTVRTGYLYTSHNFSQKQSAHLRGFLPKRQSCRFDFHCSLVLVFLCNGISGGACKTINDFNKSGESINVIDVLNERASCALCARALKTTRLIVAFECATN